MRALKEIEQAVQLDATSAPAYATLGTIQAARGRQQEAEDAFRKAVATNPERADVHLALANFLWSAIARMRRRRRSGKPSTLEPGNSLANRALATFYLSTRRAPEAEKYLRAAAETDTNPAAPLKLALADYYVSVDRPTGHDTSEALARTAPLRAAARRTRSRCSRTSDKSHADGHRADRCGAREPSARSARDGREGALPACRTARPARRSRESRAAVAIDPSSVPAHYLLGSIHRLRGDIRARDGGVQ